MTDFESRSRHDGEIEVRDDNPWHCKKTCFEIAPHELHLMEWNEWNRRSSIPVMEFKKIVTWCPYLARPVITVSRLTDLSCRDDEDSKCHFSGL